MYISCSNSFFLKNTSVFSDAGVEKSAQHPRVFVIGGGEEEGRLCLPDRSRHRDRHQAVPGGPERHREAAGREHKYPV